MRKIYLLITLVLLANCTQKKEQAEKKDPKSGYGFYTEEINTKNSVFQKTHGKLDE